MHRLRMGLTGLGFVLLLVFVAAAGMRPSHSVAPVEAEGETLSVLGVAPGAGRRPEPASDRKRADDTRRTDEPVTI